MRSGIGIFPLLILCFGRHSHSPVARAIPLAVLSLLLAASVSMGSSLGQLRAQMDQADTDKDADATIELARRILAISPRDTEAWTDFVYYQIANKDYDRALASLAAWEKAEKSQKAAIEDYRGDIYLAQEHPTDAERAWRASIAAKPSDYHVLSKLADLLEDQERWPEVLALRTRAAAAKPGAALLAAKAGALLHAHQWDAANGGGPKGQ